MVLNGGETGHNLTHARVGKGNVFNIIKLMSYIHYSINVSKAVCLYFDINSSSSSLADLATVTDKKVDIFCGSF